MNIEIQKPELVQRLDAHLQGGTLQFNDTAELIEKVFDAVENLRLSQLRERLKQAP